MIRFVLALALAACGGGGAPQATPAPTERTAVEPPDQTADEARSEEDTYVADDGCVEPEVRARVLACPADAPEAGTELRLHWFYPRDLEPLPIPSPPPGEAPAGETRAEADRRAGRLDRAATTLRELLRRERRSTRRCHWQSRLAAAVLASGSPDDAMVELRALATETADLDANDEASRECRRSAATTILHTAARWEVESVGTETSPGTNDRTTMRRAVELYELVLERFPGLDDLGLLGSLSRLTTYAVRFRYASVLFSLEGPECGPAFDAFVETDAPAPARRDASLAAVICYNYFYSRQYSQREHETIEEMAAAHARARRRGRRGRALPAEGEHSNLAPRELTSMEAGYVRAGVRHLCGGTQPEDRPTLLFRMGRIHYEAHRFPEAAALFREAAFNRVDRDVAEEAMLLYLDVLDILGVRVDPPQSRCITAKVRVLRELRDVRCGEDRPDDEANEATCAYFDEELERATAD